MTIHKEGKFEILDRTTFGEFNRYRIDRCRDRFGSIVYLVLDAEREDPVIGGPLCIRQSGSFEVAIAGLENVPSKIIRMEGSLD
ncbi:MAG: hypothetical protein IMZ57_11035 [Acidobacteria bacterium]|nr:hypothetical protein [Acidobacteriota bacterium]